MSSLQLPALDASVLNLTIRFSASIPDLLLTLPDSQNANTSTLKQQIRAHLPTPYIPRRLRLIYSGKSLADDAILSTSLRRPAAHSHLPSRSSTPLSSRGHDPDPDPHGKGKGKAPLHDHPLPQRERIYIHCSIGDVVLSQTDLAAEAALAQSHSSPFPHIPHNPHGPSHTTTTPAPRGFDRLLTTGFTQTDINSLRLQFLSIQSHTHTPETMPSPTTLRALEDEWLDNAPSAVAANLTAGGFDPDTGGIEGGHPFINNADDITATLDDLIWGATAGFFWPVASVLWVGRESGIWSRRRKMAVVMGVVVNFGVGVLRWAR